MQVQHLQVMQPIQNSATANLGKHQNNGQTRGDKATKILSGTDWQGTRVYDARW